MRLVVYRLHAPIVRLRNARASARVWQNVKNGFARTKPDAAAKPWFSPEDVENIGHSAPLRTGVQCGVSFFGVLFSFIKAYVAISEIHNGASASTSAILRRNNQAYLFLYERWF